MLISAKYCTHAARKTTLLTVLPVYDLNPSCLLLLPVLNYFILSKIFPQSAFRRTSTKVYECSQIPKNDVRRRRRRWLNGQENNLFGGIQACPVLSKRQIGTVVYGFSSYFNHSCDPNVTFIIGGKANVMLATRAVRAGQELCISYGPTFAFTARGGRLTEVSCC